MHVLVTAGPTREYIDAVRFLSSPSSGKMGFACAAAAKKRGHRVTLVTGPVLLKAPQGVRTLRVTSARDMRRVVFQINSKVDAVIMTAAVSDYRPAQSSRKKIKKTGRGMTIRLVPNPDILADLGKKNRRQVLMGFALEVQDPVSNAAKKLKEKNLDYIVLNSPRTFESDRISASVYGHKGCVKRFSAARKESVANWLVTLLEEAFGR